MKILAPLCFVVAIISCVGAAPPTGGGRVVRMWTSNEGKTLQAELLEYSSEEVKVKRTSDFQVVKIPLDRLSEEDRKLVLGMVRERKRDGGLKESGIAGQLTGQFAQGKSKEGLNYQLYGNPKWEGAKRYPLVVWLHGAGQSGDDNTSQLGGHPKAWFAPEAQEKQPCFGLAPQCPSRDIGWRNEPAENLMALIGDLVEALPIDESRIYLTGSSMGGSGTWNLLAHWPEVFACGVPLCGGGDVKTAETIKDIPVWVFHGDQDDQVPVDRSRSMVAALEAVGGKITYSELKGEGHLIAGVVFAKPELHEWIFQQRRGGESEDP